MTRVESVAARLATVLMIGSSLITACDRKSRTPIGPTSTTTTSTPVVAQSISIAGETNLNAPDQTSQLTATVRMSDGTTSDVTRLATWFTRDPSVASVFRGLVTSVSLGITTLTVGYGPAHTSATIRVMPDGTFQVAGTVYEPVTLPIPGAIVRVVNGSSANRSTTTTNTGSFALAGISGAMVSLEFSKDGYATKTLEVALTSDISGLAVNLDPNTPPDAVAGVYRLKISASPSCETLREDARERQYTATIDQAGARLTVTLSGAEFFSSYGQGGNQIPGRISGNQLDFWLAADDYYGIFSVAEIISPTDFIDFAGSATVTRSGNGFAGDFAGRIEARSRAKYWETLQVCAAADHRLTLTPMTSTVR